MNESKQSSTADFPAMLRGWLARVGLDVGRLSSLVAATLLFVLALFLAWQAWLIWRTQVGSVDAQRLRTELVESMARQVESRVAKVREVLLDPAVQAALEDDDSKHAAARRALLERLSGVSGIEFFGADLDEVLAGDLRQLGYAKAAALMLAKVNRQRPLAEVRSRDEDGEQALMLALPAKVGDSVRAFVVFDWPFAPILGIFRGATIHNARLELRQGDGRGDQIIAGIGEGGISTIGDLGVAIPGTRLRIGVGEPNYLILVPHHLASVGGAALLCLLAGVLALWLRRVGLAGVLRALNRREERGDLRTFSEVLAEELGEEGGVPAALKATGATAAPAPAEDEAPVAVDASIFRMYDIRGVVGQTLNPGIARLIGRAIGSEARARDLREIVVGRDGRLSGPELMAGLIAGLRAAGMDVIDIGAAPTPLTYFACFHLRTGSGVSLTGSHNPPDYNGFKIVLGGETLADEAIRDLHRRIVEADFASGTGGLQTIDVSADYMQRISDDVQLERTLKAVVDCGNGIPGALAPKLLDSIGCEVVPLYCEVDGNFPNHHPDPSDPANLQDLIAKVRETGADLGLAFDGDGDRLGVVTASGEVIYPDRLLMLFAIDVLLRNPGATIIYDVKCTGHLQPLILQQGGSPLMWKTGHSLIKAKMRETEATLAGEMSGHFFFSERWYGFDDGMYAAARLLEILAADPEERSPQAIFDTLPKGVSTPELKIPMAEGAHYRFIERFRDHASFEGARVTTLDGVRADWPDGFGLVRASNTTPVLVLRFDADGAGALQRIQEAFRLQLLALDPELSLPF